jgi:hypothetical protein
VHRIRPPEPRSKKAAHWSSLAVVRCFAWVAGVLLLLASRTVAQAPLPLELSWRAPPECPNAAAVRTELERVATVTSDLRLRPLVARVDVARRNGIYVAALRTEHEGRTGQRQLQAARCETLVRSVTLVLALAFGAGVEVRAAEIGAAGSERQGGSAAATSPQPSAAAAAQPAPSAPAHDEKLASEPSAAGAARLTPAHAAAQPAAAPDATAEIPSQAVSLAVSLSTGAQFGLLPTAAFAAGPGLELETRRFSLGVRAWLLPGVSANLHVTRNESTAGAEPSASADQAEATARSSVSAQFAAFGAAVRGCVLFPLEPVVLATCADFDFAAVRGETDDAAKIRADSAVAARYAVGAGVAADWPRAASLRLRLEANLAIALNRPRFDIEGLGSLYHSARWSPLLAAGLVFAL